MFVKEAILCFVFVIKCLSYAEFIIPEVTLEAYDPKGFRASIPALEGIQMFAFHGNVNEEITQVDPGHYSQDYTQPEGNLWSYYNPDLKLKIGDEVHYWIFIQYQKLGYRKDNQKWKVTELVKLGDKPCQSSESIVSGKTLICKDNIVFEDNFSKNFIDTKKWTIEQYIPTYYSQDYEFVSYQNKPDVCYVSDNKLYIKPKITDNDVYGELDLRGSCTRNTDEECHVKREIYLIVPPVTSARIVSHFMFRYGKIEIRAKLPSGDWIFPQIYLQQTNDPSRRLWIAYARGNDHLIANNQEDIGGSLLFGGPVLSASEPERSRYLRTKQNNTLFTSNMHTYTVVWGKDAIYLLIDGEMYGHFDKKTVDEIGFAENDLVQIVLGVGIGGVNDFPDDFKSGDKTVKPWKNNDNKQVKNFFNAKDKWSATWKLLTDNRALQVDYVKVWAL